MSTIAVSRPVPPRLAALGFALVMTLASAFHRARCAARPLRTLA